MKVEALQLPDTMDVTTPKLTALAILFSTSCGVALGTVNIVTACRLNQNLRTARSALIISLLNCFAGGVFMATGLLDIFPEVSKVTKVIWNHGYPVAEFLVAVGFFLVLTIEQIVLFVKESSPATPLETTGEDAPLVHSDEHLDVRPRQSSIVGVSDHPLLTSTSSIQSEDGAEVIQGDPHSSLRSILMAVALSLHSVFEGLAIGLLQDYATLMQVCLGVLLHKTVIAFSLGLNLIDSQLKTWTTIAVIFIFSMASPIGIAAALGLEKFGHSMNTSPLNGILQGLACGTFFYVTFFEVLPHELNLGGNRMLKLLAIVLGFSLISGLLFLDPENREVKPIPTLYADSSLSGFMYLQ